MGTRTRRPRRLIGLVAGVMWLTAGGMTAAYATNSDIITSPIMTAIRQLVLSWAILLSVVWAIFLILPVLAADLFELGYRAAAHTQAVGHAQRTAVGAHPVVVPLRRPVVAKAAARRVRYRVYTASAAIVLLAIIGMGASLAAPYTPATAWGLGGVGLRIMAQEPLQLSLREAKANLLGDHHKTTTLAGNTTSNAHSPQSFLEAGAAVLANAMIPSSVQSFIEERTTAPTTAQEGSVTQQPPQPATASAPATPDETASPEDTAANPPDAPAEPAPNELDGQGYPAMEAQNNQAGEAQEPPAVAYQSFLQSVDPADSRQGIEASLASAG